MAKNKNEIFIVSPIPNHNIKSGENAVTGIYRMADTTGDTISFKNCTEQISRAIGIATAMDSKEDTVILAREYSRPGTSCPVSYNPTNAAHTDIGDGTNSGIVIIEPICHTARSKSIPKSFFMIRLLNPAQYVVVIDPHTIRVILNGFLKLAVVSE